MRHLLLAAACVPLVLVWACGAHKRDPIVGTVEGNRPYRTPVHDAGARTAEDELGGHVVASVPDKTVGPFLARREGGGLLAYALDVADGRRLVGVPLDARLAPAAPATALAPLPGATGSVVVRTVGGPGAGYVLATTSLVDRGEALSVLGVDSEGKPRGPMTELVRSQDDIVWVEVAATPSGGICAWAEQTAAGTANILAVALDAEGRARGVPSHLARGVAGWQLVPTHAGAGATLAFVTPPRAAPKPGAGELRFLRLGADARPSADPRVVGGAVGADFDVVESGKDGLLFAWTDRAGLDPEVHLSSWMAGAESGTSSRPFKALGGSSLIALAAGRGGAALAWDEPARRGAGARRLHVAKLGASAVESALELDVLAGAAVELEAGEDGFALLATARACTSLDEGCRSAPFAPRLVALDTKLAVTQVESLGSGEHALAWGLDCTRAPCAALAAGDGKPTPVRVVPLAARPAGLRLATVGQLSREVAEASELGTLAAGEQVVDVSAASRGTVSTVASLLADGPDGRGEGTILVHRIDGSRPPGAARTLTKRALALGGVAVAVADRAEQGGAVAWVGRDSGDPQVHLTRLDASGAPGRDQLVTTQRGDASDVALAWIDGAWLVAWSDTRDGNGEVYAARVSADGSQVGTHQRITRAPGDATDLVLATAGDIAWLAWADSRESPRDGFSDILLAPFSRRTGALLPAGERRVLATAAHSRSPALAAAGDGLALSWIEESPAGGDGNSASVGAMLAWLDPHGAVMGEITRLRGAGEGTPTAVTLEGTARGEVRVVLARSTKSELVLDASRLGRGQPPVVTPLLTLNAAPSFDIPLRLQAGALIFADSGAHARDGRLRRMALDWK